MIKIFLLYTLISTVISDKKILELMKFMEMKNPIIIDERLNTRDSINIFKSIIKRNQMTLISNRESVQNFTRFRCIPMYVHFNEYTEYTGHNIHLLPIIISDPLQVSFTNINEKVFYMNDNELWEHYEYKTFKKSNLIAKFHANETWIPQMSTNFMERRGNLNKSVLYAMTAPEMKNVMINNEKELSPSNIVPDSYDVTENVRGKYNDLLYLFADSLNFTVKQFKRIDGKWGGLDEITGKENLQVIPI